MVVVDDLNGKKWNGKERPSSSTITGPTCFFQKARKLLADPFYPIELYVNLFSKDSFYPIKLHVQLVSKARTVENQPAVTRTPSPTQYVIEIREDKYSLLQVYGGIGRTKETLAACFTSHQNTGFRIILVRSTFCVSASSDRASERPTGKKVVSRCSLLCWQAY